MTTILTAALPYGNADIHIGHLVEYAMADIYARSLRLRGEKCVFVCADDAHGTPIQLRAEAENISPEELIDRVRLRHIEDFKTYGVDFDNYHSTHSPENQHLVELFFSTLKERGYLLEQNVKQLYDPVAQRFLSDRYVKGDCPKCGAKDQYGDSCEACGATYDALDLNNPVSQLSAETPISKSSLHVFFNLPGMREFLLEWQDEVGLQIPIRNKLKEWFDGGLRPWDISRDAPYWGFELPGYPSKYAYVWLDAPIGYIASLHNWAERHGLNAKELWQDPNNQIVHVIGKDIAYFHTIFWPAILNGVGWRTPTQIQVHGFLTVNGQKMSKSRGTMISAAKLATIIEPELFRYFLFSRLNDGINDIDLNFEGLVQKVNSGLVNSIINLGSRSSKILATHFEGRLTKYPGIEEHLNLTAEKVDEITSLMQAFQMSKASQKIDELASEANQKITADAPWKRVKEGATESTLAQIACTEAMITYRALLVGLSPVCPKLSERGLKQFSLNVDALNKEGLLPILCDVERVDNFQLGPFTNLAERVDITIFEELDS